MRGLLLRFFNWACCRLGQHPTYPAGRVGRLLVLRCRQCSWSHTEVVDVIHE